MRNVKNGAWKSTAPAQAIASKPLSRPSLGRNADMAPLVAEDFNDVPPAEIVDADVPADIFYNSHEFAEPPPPPKPDNDLEYAAELTQADKIEAACSKVHPSVRAFIEDELRARFVAVHTLAGKN